MWTLARALVYATGFIGFLLVFLPARILSASGVARGAGIGVWQIAGAVLTAIGAAVALWCILTFVVVGQGTPAPFDAPRRLVVRGPYRFLRNPMYVGAILALAGAALYYGSLSLAGYAVVFAFATHAMVVVSEEPALGRLFGAEYEAYRRRVGRWWPRLAGARRPTEQV